MKKSFLGLLFGIVFLFGNIQVVKSEGILVNSGFITGNDYLNRINQRVDYLMGVADGMRLAPLFGASEIKMKWFEDCINRMPHTQLQAIVDKHLKDNPDKWKYPMHILAFQSLNKACPNSLINKNKR